MILVNLFGTAGAGKSTGAAYIFAKLKMAGVNAELAQEYAKDKVWEESKEVFNNQAYIFGKQFFRLTRVQKKVDVIVTDSPLILSIFYNKDELLGDEFNSLVYKVFNSYNSKNYMVNRIKPYNPNGRFQDEAGSDALVKPMLRLLDDLAIDYDCVNGDVAGYDKIVEDVLRSIKAEKNKIRADLFCSNQHNPEDGTDIRCVCHVADNGFSKGPCPYKTKADRDACAWPCVYYKPL